ncbi:MAG: putative two-component sensor histidine kinase protein [Frankiales bacterium]|nr:putative two-component sensor histidine kinase protein [Frankiales bacterium]
MLADLDDIAVEAGQHVVHFYERDENLALAVSSFLGAGLVAGESVLVVATPAHSDAFDAVLVAAGIDVPTARAAGKYRSVDASKGLASFMVDGRPDTERFDASVGATVAELSASGTPVRIYGEMVALLWEQGDVEGAMAVEEQWNDLGRRSLFTLFCAYPSGSVAGTPRGRHRICQHHSAVVAERRSPPAPPDERTRRFEPTVFAAPAARRFVTEALHGWGRHAVLDATELVVSEMVTNAIRHGGRPFRVSVSVLADAVRVSVTDPSPKLPTLRPDDPEVATGGRGLHLIAALARRWGTHVHNGGKTVWAEIDESVRGRTDIYRPAD